MILSHFINLISILGLFLTFRTVCVILVEFLKFSSKILHYDRKKMRIKTYDQVRHLLQPQDMQFS